MNAPDELRTGDWCEGCGSPIGPDDEEGPGVTFPEGRMHFQCWENRHWHPDEVVAAPIRDEAAELRARAEKAEAERDAATRRAMDAEEGEANLQLGIEALAGEWEDTQTHRHATGMLWAEPSIAALRGLLSPTPEGPTDAT